MQPGVMAAIVPSLKILRITSNQVDFDLFAALGSPSFPVFYIVELAAGVAITSSANTVPAWRDDGIHADSRIFLSLHSTARIAGAGGKGGDGGVFENLGLLEWWYQASGGGGAGAVPGQPGFVYPAGNPGAVGSATAGGAGGGGANLGTPIATILGTRPDDGGDAMRIGCLYEILNPGQIWGGGGGGCASWNITDPGPLNATAGGPPGGPGVTGSDPLGANPFVDTYQSSGGNAIRLVGGTAAAVFLSGGSSPNVEGAVSA